MSEKGEGKRVGEHERRLRVLVVEDEFVVSLTLKVQLEALGCEVVGSARDADSAVEMARELQPDVVLMDIGLPGRNGVEATREIMAEAPTKVIVVTAYGDERVREALKVGARLVLTKPIVEEQLAQAIAKVTGGERGGSARRRPKEE
jgi:DNA-binding NarL/FixJ family response regulator